jgi:hypothetical protein
MLPLLFVLFPLMIWMMPRPQPGHPLRPEQVAGSAGRFLLIWVIIMVGQILLQVQAMRWMLKTRWSDFRLAATDDEVTR